MCCFPISRNFMSKYCVSFPFFIPVLLLLTLRNCAKQNAKAECQSRLRKQNGNWWAIPQTGQGRVNARNKKKWGQLALLSWSLIGKYFELSSWGLSHRMRTCPRCNQIWMSAYRFRCLSPWFRSYTLKSELSAPRPSALAYSISPWSTSAAGMTMTWAKLTKLIWKKSCSDLERPHKRALRLHWNTQGREGTVLINYHTE